MGRVSKIIPCYTRPKKRGIAKQPQGKEKQNDKNSNEFKVIVKFQKNHELQNIDHNATNYTCKKIKWKVKHGENSKDHGNLQNNIPPSLIPSFLPTYLLPTSLSSYLPFDHLFLFFELLNQLPLHSHCLIRWKRRKNRKRGNAICMCKRYYIYSFIFFQRITICDKMRLFHLPMSLKIMAFIPMRVVDHNLHLHNLT